MPRSDTQWGIIARGAARVAPYWKAVLGFVLPGAVVIGSAVTSVSDGGQSITTAEWVTAAVACVVTGGGVFAKGNKDPKATHQEQSVQPPQAGYGDVLYILLVVVVVLVILALFGVLR